MNLRIFIKNKFEYIVPACAAVAQVISCIIISQKKYFWNDELYSYYLLADQSFTHMLGAFHDKINNTPPLYFLLGWFWTKVFSSTELSLRLFSSLGMVIACVIVWVTLRRTYNFWSASVGVLSVFCTSSIILSQNAEARMYGLFIAFCALGLLQYDTINRNIKNTWKTLLTNIFIHAAIVNTHLYGLFYSGAILIALILRDRYFKICRRRTYISIVLSWLSIVPYIPSFINQADAGNPRSWLSKPYFKDLINLLNISSTSSSFFQINVLVLLVLISGLQFLIYKIYDVTYSQIDRRSQQNFNSERSLLIFAYIFLAVPVCAWIVSRTVKPIFFDRYMISSALSWSILLAYLCERIIFNPITPREITKKLVISKLLRTAINSGLLIMLTAELLLQPISYAKGLPQESLPGLNDNRYGYKDLPIVVQLSHDFFQRFYYSSQRNRYFFILDRQAAIDSKSGLFPPQEYKHLDAFKRNYPKLFQDNITDSKDFLNKYERFLVLDYLDYNKDCSPQDFHCPLWLEMRIISNHQYKVISLGEIENRKLLLVEKIRN